MEIDMSINALVMILILLMVILFIIQFIICTKLFEIFNFINKFGDSNIRRNKIKDFLRKIGYVDKK